VVAPRFEAVLFDFGHTLFGPAERAGRCVTFAAERGIEVDPAEVTARIAAAWDRARTPAEIAKGRDLNAELHRACWLDLYAPLDELAPGMAAFLYEGETSAVGWAGFVETESVLRTLHGAGVRLAIVSDVGFDLRPVVEAHGLDRYVSAYVLSYEHGVTKPHRTMFERACADLGVVPAHALMVGDSPAADGGAAAVGIPVLLLPPHHDDGPRGLDLVLRIVLGG